MPYKPTGRPRGRPRGHKLSQETKDMISASNRLAYARRVGTITHCKCGADFCSIAELQYHISRSRPRSAHG